MTSRRVDPWCARAVQLAARLLPPAQRQRYALELIAELYDLPRSRQVSHSLQVLASAWQLRVALIESRSPIQEVIMATTPSRPLLCRVGIHRYFFAHADDGTWYKHCQRCGNDEVDRYTGMGGGAVLPGGGFGS